MKPVTLLIVGAGGRGTGYARYAAEFPEQAKVVGVAEPRDAYRRRIAADHDIPAENAFTDWTQAAEREPGQEPPVAGPQGASVSRTPC